MPRLGDGVLVLVPCLLCWPPQPPDPAWACWGWRALATRLAPAACPWPWDGGVPRAGWGPPAPPPPLWGCRLAALLPPPPPGWMCRLWWRLRRRCGRPTLCRCPAGSGGRGVGGGVHCHALLERGDKVGRGSGEAAPRLPLREQGVRWGGGEILWLCPPPPSLPRPWLPCGASAGAGPHPWDPPPMLVQKLQNHPCPFCSGGAR